MNRLFSASTFAAAAVALGGLVAASAAQARTDVVLSIAAPVPVQYGYVQPAPVYVQPQGYYVDNGWRRDHRRGPWGDRDHDGIPNAYDRYDNRRHDRHGPWGDADGDGVPNRYDRAPNNPYRR